MSDDKDMSAFERKTKQVFDESVAGLDAATRSRLTQARYRALEELKPQRSRALSFTLVPAGALAAALLVWFTVVPPTTVDDLEVASLNDLEILLAEEDLEMLNEDLEFYGWLEEQPEFANAGDGIG
ncbi:MAG TPA: hypothetical protein VKA43_13665 [Gammaproteobacteria bacterium]|nr:hypothetical protein [Gammaproteobacteria bacterium]